MTKKFCICVSIGFYVDLKKEVDIRKEDLKFKIDNYADKITESILTTEKECMLNKRKIEENTKELAVSRRELDLLILEFDSFEINDKKMNVILTKAEHLRPKLTEKINECKNFLLNNKAYRFDQGNMDIESIFGSLRSIEQVYVKSYFKEFTLFFKSNNLNFLESFSNIDYPDKI